MDEREKNIVLMEQEADQAWAETLDLLFKSSPAERLMLALCLEQRSLKRQGMMLSEALVLAGIRRVLIEAVRRGLMPPQRLHSTLNDPNPIIDFLDNLEDPMNNS